MGWRWTQQRWRPVSLTMLTWSTGRCAAPERSWRSLTLEWSVSALLCYLCVLIKTKLLISNEYFKVWFPVSTLSCDGPLGLCRSASAEHGFLLACTQVLLFGSFVFSDSADGNRLCSPSPQQCCIVGLKMRTAALVLSLCETFSPLCSLVERPPSALLLSVHG